MLFTKAFLACVAVSSASASPSFDPSTVSPAATVTSWLSTSLSAWIASTKGSVQDVTDQQPFSPTPSDSNPFDKPSFPNSTIWEVIQENEHLSDLKRVLKYSGPRTKELLDDKKKKLTFLAPINWSGKRDEHDEHIEEAMIQWSALEKEISELEGASLSGDDDDKKKERRKIIAYLIDQTIKYHVVLAHEPLTASEITQKSSVPTILDVGMAKRVVGNLWDGEKFRLRVGKSLLPLPSLYFNFYSRLVYPDVDVGGSLVHAVSFPLLIPPSALQALFFNQPVFSTATSAMQKVGVDAYLKLPLNESYFHHHHGHDHKHKKALQEIGMLREQHYHPHGQGALTFFAPANVAWLRLPLKIRLFLFSPIGKDVLAYFLALHSLPKTIFFADWVHEQSGKSGFNYYSINPAQLRSLTGEIAMGNTNVTDYTFDTACPKFHFNKTSHRWEKIEGKFESVDVKVYRYYIFPGGKGPLQTRVSVNEVPILFQDIPTANGVLHQIERFIMPKNHTKEDNSILSFLAQEANAAGYGPVNLAALTA